MVRSFTTGIAGLNAHQKMLDVVSNNIANVNTTAYKTQRTLFADLFYETIRPATNPLAGTLGGTNPSQIGSGVQVATIDRLETQGVLGQTGAPLDMAIEGAGYFVLSAGTRTVYTRDGAFGLDAENRLVDKSTGYKVLRYGNIGEPDGINPSFQDPSDDGILVPIGATVPGRLTTELQLRGNLDAQAETEAQEELTSTGVWIDQTTSATATGATLLNDLDANNVDYVLGDQVVITGRDYDGSAVSATLAVDGTTTLNDLIAAIDAAYAGSTASLVNGQIVLTSDTPGVTSLELQLTDSGFGGQLKTDFDEHFLDVTTEGRDNATYQTEARFFDERGVEHHLELTFERVGDNIWDMTAVLDAAEGTVLDGEVTGITFDNRGGTPQVVGAGTGDANLSFMINGLTGTQSIAISLGTPGEFDGLTLLEGASSIRHQQDGFPPGSIQSVEVDSDGVLYGIATNDQRLALAQLAIASFENSQGLNADGDNLFVESVNSGAPQVGPGADGGRGAVRGGRLEASNVDLAKEFTQLIIAQRGFSANARTITITDQILEELINIVR